MVVERNKGKSFKIQVIMMIKLVVKKKKYPDTRPQISQCPISILSILSKSRLDPFPQCLLDIQSTMPNVFFFPPNYMLFLFSFRFCLRHIKTMSCFDCRGFGEIKPAAELSLNVQVKPYKDTQPPQRTERQDFSLFFQTET